MTRTRTPPHPPQADIKLQNEGSWRKQNMPTKLSLRYALPPAYRYFSCSEGISQQKSPEKGTKYICYSSYRHSVLYRHALGFRAISRARGTRRAALLHRLKHRKLPQATVAIRSAPTRHTMPQQRTGVRIEPAIWLRNHQKAPTVYATGQKFAV